MQLILPDHLSRQWQLQLFIPQILGLPLTPLSPAWHMQFFSKSYLLGFWVHILSWIHFYHRLCSAALSCHPCIPGELWDHLLPYSCTFADWFTQKNQRVFLKMCQNTPSCGKMLLTVFFLTRLNLKCYPRESLCTPSSPSLQSAAHSTPPIHSFLFSVPLLISRSTFLDF